MLLILLFGLIAAGSAQYDHLNRYARPDTKFINVKNENSFKITFTIQLYDEGNKLYDGKNLDVAIQLGDIGPAAGSIEMKDCRILADLSTEKENKPKKCDGDYGVPYSLALGDYQIGSLNGNYFTVWCPNIYFKKENIGLRPCVKYQCDGTACSLTLASGDDTNRYFYGNFVERPRDNIVLKYDQNENRLVKMNNFREIFPYTPCIN